MRSLIVIWVESTMGICSSTLGCWIGNEFSFCGVWFLRNIWLPKSYVHGSKRKCLWWLCCRRVVGYSWHTTHHEFSLLGLKLVAIVDCRCDPSRKAVETVWWEVGKEHRPCFWWTSLLIISNKCSGLWKDDVVLKCTFPLVKVIKPPVS